MKRRSVLSLFASVFAGSGALASAGPAHAARSAVGATAAGPRWTLGYRSIDSDDYQAEVPIAGNWPARLRGTFYRNGPAQHDIGDFRYDHWFDGDGLVQSFAVRNRTLIHRARPVATAKRRTEQRIGRAALPAFGTVPPDGIGVAAADDLNPANISVLPHHDRLYALWEAGSPHELDPVSLATRGLKRFSEDTAGLPFSAHPRIEPDGTLWNFGYASSAGIIVLWHIEGRAYRVEDPAPDSSFLDLHRWDPSAPTRVLVIDKDRLELTGEYELPAQWVFHFGNGYEDDAGTIHFDAARSATPEVLTHSFRSVMRGHWHEPPLPLWTEYRIHTHQRAESAGY